MSLSLVLREQRQKRRRRRARRTVTVFVAASLAGLGLTGLAGAAHLTVTSVAGSAFGIEAGGDLLNIERTPSVSITSPGSASDETLDIEVGEFLGVDVIPVMTEGSLGVDGAVESSASVANVMIGDLTDDVDGGLLGGGLLDGVLDDLLGDLLGDDGVLGDGGLLGLGSLFDDLFGGTLSADVIESECRADAEGSEGQTNIVGLEVLGQSVGEDGLLEIVLGDDSELLLALEDALDIDLGLLRVVVNEQEQNDVAGSSSEITVNALRVTILGDSDTTDTNMVDDDSLLDLIIAQSRCAVNIAPTAPPTTSTTTPGATTTTMPGATTTTMPGATTTTMPGATTTSTAAPRPASNVANNDSTVSNDSDGTAVIDTGDASAVGNVSETQINQDASTGGGGGLSFTDQNAAVNNSGEANANTGGNIAIGNNSTNVASNDQAAVAIGGGAGADNVANNTSAAANSSDGTAVIGTGNASAVGNASSTGIDQGATVGGSGTGCGTCPQNCTPPPPPCPTDCPQPNENPCQSSQPCGGTCGWGSKFSGINFINQSSSVNNTGLANANTGGNTAIGNNSTNVATNNQTAVAGG